MKEKIAFLIIGTNNYKNLALECAESLENNLFCSSDQTIDFHIFSNIDFPVKENYVLHSIPHLPWPLITLLRYQFFYNAREELAKYDYLIYIDADQRLLRPIPISNLLGDVMAVAHPGFLYPARMGSYEPNPTSTAYLSIEEWEAEPSLYFQGCLQGGRANKYLEICKILMDNINTDLYNNHIALWHDESHWNRYLFNNPPTLALSHQYAYPEGWNLPGSPIIMGMNKDHRNIRKEG